MDLRKLKTLIDLVEASGIHELEVTEGEEKVRIVKHGAPVAMPQMMAYSPGMMPQSAQMHAVAVPPVVVEAAPVAAPEAAGAVVKSPMVGTFYRSATPGGKAFVEEGETVKEGQTLCVIEAMKIMNEIQAETSGVVAQIKAQNGQPVEYGQVLFVIA